MTDNDLKIISENIDSLHIKILKSKFAETVTESEVVSLILAIRFLNRQRKKIDDLTERLEAAIAGQETLQKALAEETKNREIQAKRLREEREQKYEQIDLLCRLRNEIAEKDREVERLNVENMLTMSERNAFRTSFYEVSNQLKYAKSEAIREFAEKLTELYTDENITDDMKCPVGVIKANIQDILEEMVGENNGDKQSDTAGGI